VKAIRTLLLCLAVLFAWAPGVSHAQSDADKTTARNLAMEGQKALDADDYETAVDRFKRAEALFHAPTLLLGLARSYVGLRKYVEAMETYNTIIREKIHADASDAFKQAATDAEREVEGLDQKIGWVTINVTGADGPTVTVDGESVSNASLGVKRAVNPGDHVVKAGAEGFETSEESFSISAGGAEDVTLELKPGEGELPVDGGGGEAGEASGSSDTLQLVGFVALGVGAAGLIVGGVTGGLAMGKHGDLEDNCPNNQCPADQQDNLDSFETMGTVSTIGFIAGGVLAAVGIALVLVTTLGGDEGDEEAAATLSTELGLGHVNATLRF
jgi:hypothetical protein